MEVARLHHIDLGMNTEYFRQLHLLWMYSYFLTTILLLVFPPLAVDVDPKTKWYSLLLPDRGVDTRDPPQTIPICALAPTIPRRILPNVGWNNIRHAEI
jgi:hypothetical protein